MTIENSTNSKPTLYWITLAIMITMFVAVVLS